MESLLKFSSRAMLVFMLFVIISVSTEAATINEDNGITNLQTSIRAYPVPVISLPINGANVYSTFPTLKWYLSCSLGDAVTYSVIVRDSCNPVYAGQGYFSIQGITTTSLNIPSSLGLTPGKTYFYEVIAIFSGIDSIESAEQSFTIKSSLKRTYSSTLSSNTSIASAEFNYGQAPKDFVISQNYPNPFNPSTVISYSVPKSSFVSIKVFNLFGQEVKTLINSRRQAGYYTIQWNGDNNFGRSVSSGVYIYRVEAGQYIKTMKMMLLK
jgi:hypothetical protein